MDNDYKYPFFVVDASVIGGLGVFAAKEFIPGELVERCPVLRLERRVWGLSQNLDEHVVGMSARHTPISLPLGYGALYNHSDAPNADWTVSVTPALMEVRAKTLIPVGAEILIDYGSAFFKARNILSKTCIDPANASMSDAESAIR